MTIDNDEKWMQQALLQARRAASMGEVPVGAVLVDHSNQLLAASHNQPVSSHDPTAHAEIMVLREAGIKNNNYRLIGSTLYVTLEPCVMCVGAMIHARVKRLVYGATEYKTGAIQSACNLLETVKFNHQLEVVCGILQQPCADVMSDFFSHRREQIKNSKKEVAKD